MMEGFSGLFVPSEPPPSLPSGPGGPPVVSAAGGVGFGAGKPHPVSGAPNSSVPGPPLPPPPSLAAVPAGEDGVRRPSGPFYLLRELSGLSDLTGSVNLILHYNLEHSFGKFCGKKVKEKLSNFLPDLPGMIDTPGSQDNSSLRSLIEKPPICGNSFTPLTGALLTGFRLHAGPLPEHCRLMHIQPPKKKNKKHKQSRTQEPAPPETPSDSDHRKKKKKQREDDPERRRKKKDKKKKKVRGMWSERPSHGQRSAACRSWPHGIQEHHNINTSPPQDVNVCPGQEGVTMNRCNLTSYGWCGLRSGGPVGLPWPVIAMRSNNVTVVLQPQAPYRGIKKVFEKMYTFVHFLFVYKIFLIKPTFCITVSLTTRTINYTNFLSCCKHNFYI